MLFNYDDTFLDPELTLRRLGDFVSEDAYPAILNRIKRALGLDDRHELKLEVGGGVGISGPDRSAIIPIDSWADGYRLTFNWILDIYAWAMKYRASTDTDDLESEQHVIDHQGHVIGILLIDEIEQHLHPSMQRTIIGHLKALFPHMQIIASTHSPLVVQGAELHEVISLQRDGLQVRSVGSPDYSDFSAEDLLTASELFDTPAYSVEIENIRATYRSLVAKKYLSVDEAEELKHVGRRLAGLQILLPEYEDETIARLRARLAELSSDFGK